jgi:hypothetical protein
LFSGVIYSLELSALKVVNVAGFNVLIGFLHATEAGKEVSDNATKIFGVKMRLNQHKGLYPVIAT